MLNPAVSSFGEILLYLIGGIVFVAGALLTAWIIRPSRPNVEKLATYESGEEPVGSAWGQFNVRFYIVALVFILFDVELVFLFPWATVFGKKALIDATDGMWGWFAFVEMTIFVAILGLGLAWAWAKGLLDWVKPEPVVKQQGSPVPPGLYEQINRTVAAAARAEQRKQKE
ncbi:NADH-quinone oxidoreductase subunit A [Cesiribacter sp. SM1]|uniref:NADH-quinone oxidoreductase subunit A n=1 Tax=Cesiribacter sp. SM1 TaxID=2861196 RepID=UPI001CD61F25|nr:NADH-quinone oxidoreductase subunit A [Cesiribacter sp. SM1]